MLGKVHAGLGNLPSGDGSNLADGLSQQQVTLPHLYAANLGNTTIPVIAACLSVGACWLVLCLHLAGAWTWSRKVFALALLAVSLGIASAIACLGAVVIIDHSLQIDERSGIPFTVFFSLLIGVREELIKLIFLLPLTPFLVRFRNDAAIITIVSFVGLGFAIEENMNYYLGALRAIY